MRIEVVLRTMPLTLYSMPWSPACRAVLLLAKKLRLDMKIIPMNTFNKDHLRPEFVKLNLQHMVPTLEDNDLVIWESRAIMSYLVEQYGKDNQLYPSDPKERAKVNVRLYYDITLSERVSDYFKDVVKYGHGPDERKFELIREKTEFLESFLEGNKYVTGDNLTIADISLAVTTASLKQIGIVLDNFPNIVRWFNHMESTLEDFKEHNIEQAREYGSIFQKGLAKF